ncbi:hypothetical protein [Leptospira adleri]|nr:hypothetical protein [Leptospira adleri]
MPLKNSFLIASFFLLATSVSLGERNMTKTDSKDLLRRLRKIPNLFVESKKLAKTDPLEDPYPHLENLKKEFRNSRKSYQIGIPFRHSTTCSTGEHRFTEVQYEVVVFTKSKELKFSISESKIHEIEKHDGNFSEEEKRILNEFDSGS